MTRILGILLLALFIFTGCPKHAEDPFRSIRESLKSNYNNIRAEYSKNKAQEFNGDPVFLEEEGIWVRRKLISISESYLLDVQKTNKAEIPYFAFIDFLYTYEYGEWKDEKQAVAGQPEEERKETERCYFTYLDGNWEVSESKVLSTKRKNEQGEWEDVKPVATDTEAPPEEAAPPTEVAPPNEEAPPTSPESKTGPDAKKSPAEDGKF